MGVLNNIGNVASALNNTNPFLKAASCGCGIGSLIQKLNPCDDDTTKDDSTTDNSSTNNSSTNNTGVQQNNLNPFKNGNGNFGPKMTKFANFKWEKLPTKARNSAQTLLMDEETWNASGYSDIEEYWWEDLSTAQVEAAVQLGWDQAAWDSKYEDTDWTDLPSHAITAASSLGFTQETWDDGEWPAVGDKYWSAMTKEEKNALFVLGYREYDWS